MNGLFYAASAVAAGTQAYHASREASSASCKASRTRDDLQFVKADVEKLMMLTEALWTILKDQHGYTDEELMRRVETIDMRDGKLDGKVAKTPPKDCPACNRTIIGNHPVCLYCGHRVTVSLFLTAKVKSEDG